MLHSTVLTFLMLLATVTATNVKQCKSGQPLPLSVTIEGCEEPPCDIIKGTTAIMQVHFVGTKPEVRKLKAVVHATTLGITVPYDLPEEVSDVCSNLMYEAYCPIYKTEDVVYQFNFYVDTYYPEISVKVQLSLVDEDNESMACFVVDCKVRKGASPTQALKIEGAAYQSLTMGGAARA